MLSGDDLSWVYDKVEPLRFDHTGSVDIESDMFERAKIGYQSVHLTCNLPHFKNLKIIYGLRKPLDEERRKAVQKVVDDHYERIGEKGFIQICEVPNYKESDGVPSLILTCKDGLPPSKMGIEWLLKMLESAIMTNV